MKKNDLENLMGNIFIEDHNLHNKYTYISQIGILTIKSLMPSKDDLGVRINYKRFIEELNLWTGYRTGENQALLNMKDVEPDVYWNKRDDSTFSRIVPIILANEEYEIIEDQIIKNILFITGNLRDMFEYISISYLIYLMMEKEESIIEKFKDKIIGFAQIDFLQEYEGYYRAALEEFKGNYKVDFEKEKINIINLLNGVDNGKYKMLSDLIEVLNHKEGKTFVGKVLYSFLYGRESGFELPKFYLNLEKYLMNLRKGRINLESLEIKEYILPDIFDYDEEDVFFHTLLSDSKIIKKEIRSGVLTSYVQTKTGMYVFRKIDL